MSLDWTETGFWVCIVRNGQAFSGDSANVADYSLFTFLFDVEMVNNIGVPVDI